jgi:hypothetical protein
MQNTVIRGSKNLMKTNEVKCALILCGGCVTYDTSHLLIPCRSVSILVRVADYDTAPRWHEEYDPAPLWTWQLLY